MKSILDPLISDPQFTDSELDKLKSHIKVIQVAKGSIIQHKGDIIDKLYFVKKGLLRSYVIDDNGKGHIFMFAPEGWIIADLASHAFKEPANLYIDAIESSEIEVCNKTFFEEIIPQNRINELSGLDKLSKRAGVLQKRIIMLMSASAWERYQHFTETYPDIVQRVPQKMIASYLGITPKALSKIRGERLKMKQT